jgi:hypothetical protein
MTITRPLRRMILHFSQIALTDGLTFIFLFLLLALRPSFAAPGDPSAREIVGRQFNSYLVSGKNADVIHTQLSRYVRQYLVSIGQLDFEHRVRKGFYNRSFHLNRVLF